jgi:hypothetical protein
MEKEEKKVLNIIDGSDAGSTITEVVAMSKFPRSVVRILLARLEGAEKVAFRKVGMAKIYVIRDE